MKRATKIELLKARLAKSGHENTTIRQVAEAFVRGEPEKGICMRFRLSRPVVASLIKQAISSGFGIRCDKCGESDCVHRQSRFLKI